jgi:hypothetical protein
MTDREKRDEDRRQRREAQEAEKRRREEWEERDHDLREAWRRHHPSEEESRKDRPDKGGAT